MTAPAPVRVALVRHGRASAGWDVDPDPGLDDLGRRQAVEASAALAHLADVAMVSSPLRRCRETAALIVGSTDRQVRIEPRVAEIPSPEGVAMHARVEWLRQAMRSTWSDLGTRYVDYRDGVVAAVGELTEPAVIVSHFVAINAVIGAALGDDRVLISSLDNCSITLVDVIDGRIDLVAGGREADTLIR